jgi:hypothetical protein
VSRRPDESAALRALRESFTEDGGGHPAAELLLAYSDERSSLARDVVERIDAHLVECASCRDEVGVLGSLTISPAREANAAQEGTVRSVRQRIVSALGGPVWRPALAFAVLVVLMVPTLRMIGQNRAVLHESIEHHDDVAMTVTDKPQFEQSRIADLGAAASTAAGSYEQQARAGDRPPVAAIAPTPRALSAKGAGPVPLTTAPPPAVRAEAAPNATRGLPADEMRVAEERSWAARESDSKLRDAFGAAAMAKRHAIEPRSLSATLDFVPGGRVSIAPDVAESVTLRISVVRAEASAVESRSSGVVLGEEKRGVMLPPSVTEVDVVVAAADGRRNSRRIEVGAGRDGAIAVSVEVPLDWLATGTNHVDVTDDAGRRLGKAPFVIERPKTDR